MDAKFKKAVEGRFCGRVAIVTGASRGIGFAIAERLIAEGASVCITARREADLEEAVRSLNTGDRAIAVAGRSDDPAHRRAAIAATIDAFGSLGMLVNNAAINPLYGPLVEADLDAARKILEVNVLAPLGWVQEAHRAWMGEYGGAVLNIASVGGLVAGELLGAYNTSKAALVHLTRQLALELGPAIRVNGIAPAVVKTRFARALYEDGDYELARLYPLRRLGEPEDTAALAAFLLSDEAAWITGQTVVADGGITLTDPAGRRAQSTQLSR